jgi:hypothetical protein
MTLATLQQRIHDRLSPEWLTPSQRQVWEQLHRFHGPPHRVVNVYGPRGSGKSFLGWLMHREGHATYSKWTDERRPIHPRLVLDNAPTDRASARSVRPLVDELNIRQIILLSRRRVDEPDMPAFALTVTEDDLDHFRANLYRHLNITIPTVESECGNFWEALETYLSGEEDGRL